MMRQEYTTQATMAHLYYGRALFDFASSMCLVLPSFENEQRLGLYRQIDRWGEFWLDCVSIYSLNVDVGIFFSQNTSRAVSNTMTLLGQHRQISVPKPTPGRLVGKLHKIHHELCLLNAKAEPLVSEFLQILDKVIEGYMTTLYCGLPYSVLEYFRQTAQAYLNAIGKLKDKQEYCFFVSSKFVKTQMDYIASSVDSKHIDCNLLTNLQKTSQDTQPSGQHYYDAIDRVVCNIVNNPNCLKSTMIPILADNFLRYAKAVIFNEN